jgi:ribose transport system permease protein
MEKNGKVRQIAKRIINLKELTLVIVLAAVVIVFYILNSNYLSMGNVRGIFNSAFVMGFLAIGASCLLIGGKIDLSAGNTGMMAGVIIAILLKAGWHWVPALIVTLIFGAVTGLINAFFINGIKFAPFISTLAISAVYSGLGLVLTNAANIPISSRNHAAFLALGTRNVWIFPIPFLIMIILLIGYGIILSATGFGRRVYMTGGNSNAARLAGINPKKITTILYINNGILAGLAGALFAALMNMGSPMAVTGADLDGITAAILGGVAFTGGTGNMFGVFIGLLLLTSFQNGLVIAGLNSYVQVIASGLLLIGALILDYYRENARLKSLKASRSDG